MDKPLPENTRTIPLSQGLSAIVDAADYDWLMQWKWCASRGRTTHYVVRALPPNAAGKRGTIPMHRQIMQPETGMMVDHINHDGLDNRRENLRIATRAENSRNSSSHLGSSSPYLGVSWSGRRKKWVATALLASGKQINLGYFTEDVRAALAYDAAASEIHGEFFNPNFTPEQAASLVIAPEPLPKPTSSQYVGVAWHEECGKWMARTSVNGRSVYLGLFATELEAAQARANSKAA